jgi:hypothetical protein
MGRHIRMAYRDSRGRFYRPLPNETFEQWWDATPDGFVVVSGCLTHATKRDPNGAPDAGVSRLDAQKGA